VKAFRKLLVLTAAFASVSALQPCFSSAATDVIYHFPDVPNLGSLDARIATNGAGVLDRIASRRHRVAPARGTVKLTPAQNRGVYFTPGTALINHPELMDTISPDNITGFYFTFTSTGDSEDAIADRLVAKLSHLKNLIFVRLGRCDVSDVGALGLRGLQQLKILDLSYSLITGKSITVISKLTSLEDLTLNNVDMSKSDFSSIARLPKLAALYLRNSQVSDSMVNSLAPARKLMALDLSNNSGITDASLPTLASLPALRALNLSGTSVNCRSLNKLSRVGRIIVASRDLKGAKLQDLRKSIPNLSLDMGERDVGNPSALGAEEMHLFAPTRF